MAIEIVELPDQISDSAFYAKVLEAVALIKGLESGTVTCPCRRVYRVSITAELKRLLPILEVAATQRASETQQPDAEVVSRFALLEVK
jgi:hypothetical protein